MGVTSGEWGARLTGGSTVSFFRFTGSECFQLPEFCRRGFRCGRYASAGRNIFPGVALIIFAGSTSAGSARTSSTVILSCQCDAVAFFFCSCCLQLLALGMPTALHLMPLLKPLLEKSFYSVMTWVAPWVGISINMFVTTIGNHSTQSKPCMTDSIWKYSYGGEKKLHPK